MSNIEPYPQRGLSDYVRTGMDAGIAAIPLVGGSLQVLANTVIVPSLVKRQEAWLVKLSELLAEFEERLTDFDLSQLVGDEVFVTAVADASRIAMGTHLETKLDLLKNCLAHLMSAPKRDEFLDLQMFRFVELLSPEHFLVLQYLSNPGAWFDGRGISRPLPPLERTAMAESGLPVSGDSLAIVLRDLSSQGLMLPDVSAKSLSYHPWKRWSTDLGDMLLKFVHNT